MEMTLALLPLDLKSENEGIKNEHQLEQQQIWVYDMHQDVENIRRASKLQTSYN